MSMKLYFYTILLQNSCKYLHLNIYLKSNDIYQASLVTYSYDYQNYFMIRICYLKTSYFCYYLYFRKVSGYAADGTNDDSADGDGDDGDGGHGGGYDSVQKIYQF